MAAALAVLGAPFALLIILWAVSRAVTRRRYWVLLVALLPIGCETCLIDMAVRQAHYFDDVELNPVAASEEIVGTWRRQDESITFNADGSFKASDGSHGEWTTERPFYGLNQPARPWVFIRWAGELLVLHPPNEDPDSWNKQRGFKIVASEKAISP